MPPGAFLLERKAQTALISLEEFSLYFQISNFDITFSIFYFLLLVHQALIFSVLIILSDDEKFFAPKHLSLFKKITRLF